MSSKMLLLTESDIFGIKMHFWDLSIRCCCCCCFYVLLYLFCWVADEKIRPQNEFASGLGDQVMQSNQLFAFL